MPSRRPSRQLRKFVIPVMGPTGAGKSTFINTLLGERRMVVGETLKSQTVELEAVQLDMTPYAKLLGNYQIVIVDTPGFDDTLKSDVAILKKIAEWLKESYQKDNAVLGGVIYLHDVSLDRFTGTAQRNLDIFQALCGDDALCKVVIGTTKWDRIKPEVAKRHEDELRQDHWKALIKQGAQVVSFKNQNDPESARQFVIKLSALFKKRNLEETYLQIQKELAVQNKRIPETAAGQTLRNTLKEIFEMEKQVAGLEATMVKAGGDEEALARLREAEEQIAKLHQQLKELKIPFFRRLLRIFR
ncbi:hypothetical protein CVT26_004704 [Gymnopilus dilepis]|uniref:AIG1-type G domain-containing protein n=1 Tax=Gymnopilus dilepis TaxID=231916 RepID=A0A409XZ70_9AGAR|nr:hypothetical protein CVT26_004704 [Gymnopilus dilepis]